MIIKWLAKQKNLAIRWSLTMNCHYVIERNQLERENEERITRAKLEAERETGNQKRKEPFVDYRER